jgi:hypothetical protein
MPAFHSSLSPGLVAACALLLAVPIAAQNDSALGTFTVKGKTVVFKNVTVVRYTDPGSPPRHTLVIVGSDVQLTPADLRGTTLQARAAAGALRAVRIEWNEGFDSLITIPYHKELRDSGEPTEGGAIIDIQQYDETRLQATFTSRTLGQEWQFSVRVSAAVVDGGILETRDARPKTVEPASPASAGNEATARKRALARLGYEFKEDEFFRAIQDGAIAAVDLFIELGMKGTAMKRDGTPAIVEAATSCSYEPKEPRPQVIASLLKAGADPNGKDSNNATALIWAAQSCPVDAVKMLLEAGADVNARAKGGGTALVMAQALNRPEIVAVLKAAGAK